MKQEEFIIAFAEKGATREEALTGMELYRASYGAFEDDPVSRASPIAIRNALTTTNPDPNVNSEASHRGTYLAYVEMSEGTRITPEEADSRVRNSYGGSYSNAIKSLQSIYMIDPQGEEKKFMYQKTKPVDMLKGFAAGTSRILPSIASGALNVDLALREKMRPLYKNPETLEKYDAITRQVALLRDTATEVGNISYNKWVETVPDDIKKQIGFEAATAFGQLPLMALYLHPATSGLAAVGDIARMNDEAYQAAKVAGKSEEQSLNIGVGVGAINGILEAGINRMTAGLGKGMMKGGKAGSKEFFKALGLTTVKGQAVAGVDGFTEILQSAVTQKAATGKVDGRQAVTEGVYGYILSTFAGGMFGSINIAQSNKIKTELVGLGLTKDKASQYVSDLGSAKDETERKVLSEQISDVINERIGERVAPLLKDTPVEPEINIQAGNEKPFDSRGEIEALLKENGLESDFDIVETAEGKFIAQQKGTEDTPAIETESQQAEQAPAQEAPRQEQQTPQPIITEPITEEDAQVFGRRFPTNESVDAEFEQSEQTDLFKKLIRGDKPALLQYNQNLAGVAPEIETPANDQPELTEEEQTPEAMNEPVTKPRMISGVSEVIGISRRWNNALFAEFGRGGLPLQERESFQKHLQTAVDENLTDGVDIKARDILSQVNAGKRPTMLSPEETAAFAIRKTQIKDEIDEVRASLEDAVKSEDQDSIEKIADELTALVDDGVRVMEALTYSKTETAKSLAQTAMMIDTKSFDVVNVISEAIRVKRKNITPEERAEFVAMSSEWSRINGELNKRISELEERLSKESAVDVVEKELSESRAGKKRERAIKNRETAEEGLRKLGYRVNDIGGFTVDAAKFVSDIAISYVHEGAATLEEVVSRVKSKIPEITERNIYDALGGSIRGDAKKVRTELQDRIIELKKQAKLYASIEDAMNGLASPYSAKQKSTVPEMVEKTDKLRNELKQLASSIIQSEKDSNLAELALRQVAKIDDMIERHVRNISIHRIKSDELKAAEAKLAIANKELSLRDRVELLKEIVEFGKPVAEKKDQAPETKRMEEFRAQISILDAQIKSTEKETREEENNKKKAEKEAKERNALINEIETATRRVKEPSTPKEQKNADLKLIRSRQDMVFNLIEQINGTKPESERSEVVDIEDSEGYLEMITNLKADLKSKRLELAKQKAYETRVKNAEKTLTDLTEQLKLEYRVIKGEKKDVQPTGLEEQIADKREAIRDYDAVAELFDVLTNKIVKPSKTVTKEKNDPYGLKAAAEELRNEIKASEFFNEWRLAKNESQRIRNMHESIEQMEADLLAGNLDPYLTKKQKKIVRGDEEVSLMLRKHQLEKEINKRIRALRTKTNLDKAFDVYDFFRDAKLMADIGHVFRQGGFFVTDPTKINLFEFTKQSADALVSEDKANALDLWVLNNDYYKDAVTSRLRLIEEGGVLDTREQIISEGLITKIPVLKGIAKASGRAQITGMNVLRMTLYEGFCRRNPEATPTQREEFAWAINVLTGYGQSQTTSTLARSLGRAFTSVRFMGSRVEAPLMIFDKRLWGNKYLLKELSISTAFFIGTRLAMFALLKTLLGDRVEIGDNPDHHTFGKLIVRINSKYSRVYDPWAGLQQVFRAGFAISRLSGRPEDISADFLKNKVHPAISTLYDVAKGKSYPDKDIPRWEAVLRSIAPISVTGVAESIASGAGPIDSTVASALDILGVSSYIISNKDLKNKTDWEDRDSAKKGKKSYSVSSASVK